MTSAPEINFGKIKKYFSDRGFGFIERIFYQSGSTELFFHIKKIKKALPELAIKLDDEENYGELYLWYEVENTSKGDNVFRALSKTDIEKLVKNQFPSFDEKIKLLWLDIDIALPAWIYKATCDLSGEERANDYKNQRIKLKEEREAIRIVEEEKLNKKLKKDKKKLKQRLKKEKEKAKKRRKEENAKEEVCKKEFKKLVAEIKNLNFTESHQVSNYIIKNRLGQKYQNISGIVRMKSSDSSWDFKGGFPPEIYSKLCIKLGLKNKGTHARVVKFTAFKDI